MHVIHHLILGKRRPIVLCTMTALGTALAVALLCTIGPARREAVPMFIDVPPYLLPGSPLPPEAQCAWPLDDWCHSNSFYLTHTGKQVHLLYDPRVGKVKEMAITAYHHTIGDLITAWGTPSGFARYGRGIHVYWGTRDAYLNTCSFGPDSYVEQIVYYLEPQVASRWRGFTSNKGCQESG